MAPMKRPVELDEQSDFHDSCSLTHLAHRWGVSRREVRRLLQQGKLPFVEVLRQLRVPRSAVESFELRGPQATSDQATRR